MLQKGETTWRFTVVSESGDWLYYYRFPAWASRKNFDSAVSQSVNPNLPRKRATIEMRF
jgi:hypothetical protein